MATWQERLELSVYGAAQLEQLARRLREAGDVTLRRRMMAALRKSGADIADAERAAARDLPAVKYETGLRVAIADAVTVRTRTSANRAGVRVLVNRSKLPEKKRRLPVLMNKGAWRHPVFGNRENWVNQTSDGGWWLRTAEAHVDEAQRRMLDVLRETAAQITGE